MTLTTLFKTLNRKRKFIIRLAVFTLCVMLLFGGVIFGIQKITTAKPGDLLFSVKAYTERAKAPSDEGDLIEYGYEIFTDRISAYKELYASNNCVQMLLAEEELIKSLKDTILQIKTGGKFDYYAKLYDSTKGLTSDASSLCTLDSTLQGLTILLTYLELRNNETVDLEEELKQAKLDYDAIITTVQTSAFSDQDTLDIVNAAVIEAENNTSEFRRNDNDQLLYNLIKTNNYLYGYINDQLGIGNSAVTQQKLAELICRISDAERCAYQKFEEDWNSIKSVSDIVTKVDLGNQVLEEYLALL